MAKIKFGMMMTDARGKLGGQVFSKNRAGAFVRTKVTPSNPQTSAQLASRSILASLSINWNTLTEAQRASWNGAVENWQKTDVFGDLKKPSGKNLFVALNKNILPFGLAVQDLAPEKTEIPAVLTNTVEIDNTAGTITMESSVIPAGFLLQISATAQLNQGVSFVKGKFRVLQNLPAGTVSPTDLYTAYVARFGTPVADANIHFQIKLLAVTGQAGIPVTSKATITA